MKLKTIKVKVKSKRGFKIMNESDYEKQLRGELETAFENGDIVISKLDSSQLKLFSGIYDFDYKNVRDSKKIMKEIEKSLSLDM